MQYAICQVCNVVITFHNSPGVKQGCVTALALVNDSACDVTFMVDEALVDGTFEKVFFHPLVNSATTGISPADFLKFLQHTGHKVIKLPLEVT